MTAKSGACETSTTYENLDNLQSTLEISQLITKDEHVHLYKLQQNVAVVVFCQDAPIKVLGIQKMFASEHQSIVRKLQEGFLNDGRFYVMAEYGLSMDIVLHSNINGKFMNYSVINAILWCKQVADGLTYLHSLDIVHKSLNPSAIILTDDFLLAKVAYFGTDQSLDGNDHQERYIAPEIKYEMLDEKDFKTNVYEVGTIIWETFHRKQYNCNEADEAPQILQLIYTNCLRFCSNSRPDMCTVFKLLSVICKRRMIDGGRLLECFKNVQLDDAPEPPRDEDKFVSLWEIWEINNLRRQFEDESIVDVDNLASLLKSKQCPECVAKGIFGEMYKIQINKTVAIKVVKGFEYENELCFYKELSSFIKIAEDEKIHKNIVSFFGSGSLGNQFFIVLEYAPCSLHTMLHETVGGCQLHYSIGNALMWSRDVSNAVNYLHSFQVPLVHFDLNPCNILLFNDYQVAKITDYGMTRLVKEKIKQNASSMRYMAPEVCVDEKNVYSDVYSAGAVFWEIYNRKRFEKSAMNECQTHAMLARIYEPCLLMESKQRPSMAIVFHSVKNLIIEALHPKETVLSSTTSDASGQFYPFLATDPYFDIWQQWETVELGIGSNWKESIMSHMQPPMSRIFVFGGCESESSVCSMSILGNQDWRAESFSLPRPRAGGAAVVLSNGRRVLLAGGWDEAGSNADVIELDASSPTDASTIAALNNAPLSSRFGCDGVPVDWNTKAIVACGGNSESILKSVELFTESLGRFVHLPDMNDSRLYVATAVDSTRQPNLVIATGGMGNRETLKTCEWFDLAKICWSAGAEMVNDRFDHAAASLGGRVFVTGGSFVYHSMECLDARESRWQEKTNLLNERSAHRLLAVGDHMLFAIGGSKETDPVRSVEIFDDRNEQWREAKPLPTGRWNFQSVLL